MLKTYVYLSRPNGNFNIEELEEHILGFKETNDRHSITGFMTYDEHKFFQYIEGQEQEMNQLIFNLSKDNRHEIILDVSGEVDKRRFEKWKMKYIESDKLKEVFPENMLINLFTYYVINRDMLDDWQTLVCDVINQLSDF